MSGVPPKLPPGMTLDGRNGAIWRQVKIYARTMEDVAQEYGLSHQRVSQIIAAVEKDLPKLDLDAMRRESLELLAEVKRRALDIADMVAAPVAAGKDGNILRDPENNNAVVRDFAGKIKALEVAVRTDAERRKLMGLDAASKTEITGAVRYEIVGVESDDLT